MHYIHLFMSGCSSHVTPTNDEGLPYGDNRWHLIEARRVDKIAYISVDRLWQGLERTKQYNHSICFSSTYISLYLITYIPILYLFFTYSYYYIDTYIIIAVYHRYVANFIFFCIKYSQYYIYIHNSCIQHVQPNPIYIQVCD